MFGKLFAQMYEGTLATKGPWQAIVTFQQFIILSDRKGYVDMTPEAISRRTTIPLEVIQTGIVALEQPDTGSRSPAEEGRRIVRLSDSRDWGWRIVNYNHYRTMRSQDERAAYHANYWNTKRSPNRKNNTQHTQHDSTNSTNGSKQYAVSSREGRKRPSTPCPPEGIFVTEEMHDWAVSKGLPADRVKPETEAFISHHRSKDSRFVNWNAAWQKWIVKEVGFREGR